MKYRLSILYCLIVVVFLCGCSKKATNTKSTVSGTNVTSEKIEEITGLTPEQITRNNEQALRRVQKINIDIKNNEGSFITKDTDYKKLQSVDFVSTERVHNLYCLFEYNGNNEPIITFTSPSGVEYTKDSPDVEYSPKGNYSLGVAYEIMGAEAGQWKINFISNGSSVVNYSVVDITDFTLNLIPNEE